jgi:hypothetical protein
MKNRLPLLPLIALIIAGLACAIDFGEPSPMSQEQIDTLAAQTMAYIQWQTYAAQGTQAQPPAADTLAPPPAVADTATYTMLPSVTQKPIPCNWAQFVADVNYPDSSEVGLSDHFTKTWRLKNIGSCTWTSGYALKFDTGDQMGAPASQQLTTGTVAPGGTIDVSVDLVSPNVAGTYQGFFKLRASDSTVFGIGDDANTAFWVKVVVKAILAPPVAAPVTQQVSKMVDIPANGTMSTTAACPPGTAATGGGFNVASDVQVYVQAKNGNGWTAVVKNTSGSVRQLTVYAICLTLPSISTTMVSDSITVVGGGGLGTKAANCPAGSVVTGGGYTGKADGSMWTFFTAQSGNGWQVSERNFGAGNQAFDVYAVCLSGAPVTTSSFTGYKDISAGTTGFAEIKCPTAGQVITGGGWNLDADLTVFFAATSSGYWRVYAKNNGSHTRALQARATCLAVA